MADLPPLFPPHPAALSTIEERFYELASTLWANHDDKNMNALSLIAAARTGLFEQKTGERIAEAATEWTNRAASSYLRGHAEEALDSTTRAALFWAAEHIESGDHLAHETLPEREEK